MTSAAAATAALALALVGCAGSPARVALLPPEKLQTLDDAVLCQAYGHNGDPEVRRELERREAFDAQTWALISSRTIRIGMSRAAALCAWGPPIRVNRTATAGGTYEQWTYGDPLYSPRFLYLTGNTVTAVQN